MLYRSELHKNIRTKNGCFTNPSLFCRQDNQSLHYKCLVLIIVSQQQEGSDSGTFGFATIYIQV